MAILLTLLISIIVAIIWHYYLGNAKTKACLSEFNGKRIIITGPSKGIGKKMAHTCAKQGAHLILASRDVDRLSKVSEECIRLGAASARVIAFDASVTDDCERLVEEAFPDGIDLLILNHAWSLWQHMDFGNPRANVDLVKALAATNYFGYVAIAQFALPRMTNVPGSKLLAVSSAASFVPIPSKTHAYSASKGAINNYFTALRSQLRIAGYRSPSVTLAFLGAINTEDFSVVVKDSLINKSTVSAESTGEAMLLATLQGREEICFPGYVFWVRLVNGLAPGLLRKLIEATGLGME